MDKKVFTPKKLKGWQIVVEGSKNEAYIRGTGKVPFEVQKAIETKSSNGLINTFDSLCHLAGLLTA